MGLAPTQGSDQTQEVVEQERAVPRPGMRLRMELHAEVRARARAYALVGSVVDVHEPGFPVRGQGRFAHGVAVVLAGHIATPGQQVLDRLVHAAMAVRQLVGIGTGGKGQYLVAKANTEYRLEVRAEQRAHLRDERAEVFRIAR